MDLARQSSFSSDMFFPYTSARERRVEEDPEDVDGVEDTAEDAAVDGDEDAEEVDVDVEEEERRNSSRIGCQYEDAPSSHGS